MEETLYSKVEPKDLDKSWSYIRDIGGVLKDLDGGRSWHWVCCFQGLSGETHTLCLLAHAHVKISPWGLGKQLSSLK